MCCRKENDMYDCRYTIAKITGSAGFCCFGNFENYTKADKVRIVMVNEQQKYEDEEAFTIKGNISFSVVPVYGVHQKILNEALDPPKPNTKCCCPDHKE